MIFNSIRWRLQAWHGLILVVVLTGFGVTAYHVAWQNQLRRIDQELEQRLGALFRPGPPATPVERSPGPPGQWRNPWRFDAPDFASRLREQIQLLGASEINATNSHYYIAWQPDGVVLARSADAPSEVPVPEPPLQFQARSTWTNEPARKGAPPGPEPALARTRGELREVYMFLPWRQCVLVGRSLGPDLTAMHRLALWLTAAGSGILLVGLAGGWWLAARAIQPIEAISATAVKIAAGELSQRIAAEDTDSELGRLAGVLNSTFARLEAAFSHQARFTSDASHELRTPVSVILAQTQSALSRDRSSPEYRQALEACQRAAQRMRQLTESLLELARLDAGQELMKRERFDLARVAGDCVEMLRPLAAERRIEIRCDLPETPCTGDAERIAQVATNLLTNAIHFNRENGEVRVSARAENGTAQLTVADKGQGIPAEDLPHIFERFYRVEKSRARHQGHSGLGLAISKAIIDAHGGSIEVLSEPQRGSVFTFKLPAK
jgi:two-component system, OmpR family, sensor kinase